MTETVKDSKLDENNKKLADKAPALDKKVGKNKDEAEAQKEKIKTSAEIKEEKKKIFESKKIKLDASRNELADRKKAIKDMGVDVDAEYPEHDHQNKVAQEYYREGALKELIEQNEKTENEILLALKEEHNADIHNAIESVDLTKLDPTTRKVLHETSLEKSVKVEKLPQKTKEEALQGIKGEDGKDIDFTKPLAPTQAELVQKYQTARYLEAIKQIKDEDKNDPKKIKEHLDELEKQNPGIKDFVGDKNIALFSEESFFEEVKNDRSLLNDFVKSIQEDGMIATGIDPSSTLGKSLVEVIRVNTDKYLGIKKPQEGLVDVENFKGLKDILDGSYEDLVYSKNFLLGEDHPLKKGRDVVLAGFQDEIAQLEVPDPKKATPQQLQEYKKSLETSFHDATGINGAKVEKVISGIARDKLSPVIKFFLDFFAPIGAMMGGQLGERCRAYMAEQNADSRSENSRNNKNYEQYGKGSGGIEGLQPGSILAAANKYMGMTESKNGADIREMHKSGGLDAGPGTPWCMSFVQHVLRKDMKFTSEQIGTGPTASAAAGHRIGRHTDNPQLGDIILVKSSAAPSGNHIAFFAGFEGNRVKLLGGNQGNAVSLTTYPKSAIDEFRTLQKDPNAISGSNSVGLGETKSGNDSFPDGSVGPDKYPSGDFLKKNGTTPESVPMGMRVNNPLNIKFTGSPVQRNLFEGVVGKSIHTDQGDPQIAFATPEAGMISGLRLLLYKQKEHGLNTVQSMIADTSWGWTQGGGSSNPLGNNAAREIAQRAGLSLTGELNLSDKTTMKRFVQSLLFQEHGASANIYSGVLDSSIAKLK